MRPCIAIIVISFIAQLCSFAYSADDKDAPFSGPQVGEKISGFKVAGVFDDLAGKEIDPVAQSGDKPTLLIFFHQVSRPAAALVRSLDAYADSRKKDKLNAYIVWLAADRSETEQFLTRARKPLGLKSPVGISVDGQEGPGSYGLNRNVALTIILASKKKVVANFALVQPAVTDGPKIAKAITELIGGDAPTLEQLQKLAYPGRNMVRRPADDSKRPATRPAARTDSDTDFGPVQNLLRQMINKQATAQQIEKAAEAIEKLVGENEAYKPEVLRIAHIVIAREYGTEPARKRMQGLIDTFSKPAAKSESDTPKTDPAKAKQPEVYSGPQPGEKLPGFKVAGVYDKLAGKEFDWVKQTDGKPLVLIIVHKLTRPGLAVNRVVCTYARTFEKKGLSTYIVWLSADRSEAEQYLTRARKSLKFQVPVGISVDGQEGPGSLGLNRNVELTILIANKNKVTANFALVQPSVTDTPKIAAAIAGLFDDKAPTLAELTKLAYPQGMMRRRPKRTRQNKTDKAQPDKKEEPADKPKPESEK